VARRNLRFVEVADGRVSRLHCLITLTLADSGPVAFLEVRPPPPSGQHAARTRGACLPMWVCLVQCMALLAPPLRPHPLPAASTAGGAPRPASHIHGWCRHGLARVLLFATHAKSRVSREVLRHTATAASSCCQGGASGNGLTASMWSWCTLALGGVPVAVPVLNTRLTGRVQAHSRCSDMPGAMNPRVSMNHAFCTGTYCSSLRCPLEVPLQRQRLGCMGCNLSVPSGCCATLLRGVHAASARGPAMATCTGLVCGGNAHLQPSSTDAAAGAQLVGQPHMPTPRAAAWGSCLG
jgi:hypothetical protein